MYPHTSINIDNLAVTTLCRTTQAYTLGSSGFTDHEQADLLQHPPWDAVLHWPIFTSPMPEQEPGMERETERDREKERERERFRLRNAQKNTRQETCQQSFNKYHTHTPYNTRPGRAYDRASNPAILVVRGLHKALWLLAETPAVLHRAEVVRIYGQDIYKGLTHFQTLFLTLAGRW